MNKLLSLFRKHPQPEPILEIIRAVRVLQKKRIPAVLIVEKSKVVDQAISAEEIVNKALSCPQGAIKLNFAEIRAVNCLLPFPKKICRKDFSDQELGCLGLSQNSKAIAISISKGGEVAIIYQNSIRRSISSKDLHSLFLFLLDENKERNVPVKYLAVKKA